MSPYKQVKDFLNLPLVFKGVSDASEKPGFFRGMVGGCLRTSTRTMLNLLLLLSASA